MEQEFNCPHCGTTLEEDDCYDTSFDGSTAVRYIVGHCPKCEREYQWKELFEYTGCDELTEV